METAILAAFYYIFDNLCQKPEGRQKKSKKNFRVPRGLVPPEWDKTPATLAIA